MIDFKRIKSEHNIVNVIGSHIELNKQGVDYIGLCPFHNERTPSLVVSEHKQIFKCFGCGVAGDIFDFFTKQGKTLNEAANIIQSGPIQPLINTDRPTPLKSQQWTPIDPAPFFSLYKSPRFFHFKHGEPSNVYTYHAHNGSVLGYTCRFDFPDGSKQVLPFTYCTNGQRDEWRWRGLNTPRPLYNLHLLQRALPVIICEGEKTADALYKTICATHNVLTWIGGKEGVKYADWMALNGRSFYIWPDNDDPGEQAAHEIISMLSQYCYIGIIQNPPFADKGWDFADSNWDTQTTLDYIENNAKYI